MPGLLYAETEEILKVIVRHFVEKCMRKDLRFNTDNSNVMVLGGEVGSM